MAVSLVPRMISISPSLMNHSAIDKKKTNTYRKVIVDIHLTVIKPWDKTLATDPFHWVMPVSMQMQPIMLKKSRDSVRNMRDHNSVDNRLPFEFC
jgi:hypothetical protein